MSLRALLPARIEATLRNLVWRLRARGIPDPVLPPDVRSVLFICKGNICRSPFAEVHARQIAPPDRPWTIGSAGITPSRELVCPVNAVAAAVAYGVDLRLHRAAPLDVLLAQSFDLLVVMDYEQYTGLCDRWPHLKARIVLLSLFDAPPGTPARERLNIADPHGKNGEAFAFCYARLDRSIRRLLDQLKRRPAT